MSMGGNEVQMEPKFPLLKLAMSAAASASWPGRDTLLDLLFIPCTDLLNRCVPLPGFAGVNMAQPAMCEGLFEGPNRPVHRVPVSPPQ